jgi:LPXTG-motif cell wall-anchored protein
MTPATRRTLHLGAAVLAALTAVAAPAQAQGESPYTLQVEDVAGVEPGTSFTTGLTFAYTGATPPEHGVHLTFASSGPLETTADYANCGAGFCVFEDFTPEPGVVYELAAPLTATLGGDAVGKAFANDFAIADLAAGAADGLEFNDADTVLAFEVSDDQSIEHHPYMLVTVADPEYDVAVGDHGAEGGPGETLAFDLSYTNLGPSDATAYEHPGDAERHFVMAVDLPDGLEVVHQGPGVPEGVYDIDYYNYCLIYPDYQDPAPDPAVFGLDAVDLLCSLPGELAPGETVTVPIDGRTTADAVSNDGAVAILEQSLTWEEVPPEHLGTALPEYPVFEADFEDNTAGFHLEVTGSGAGGGKLPETGGSHAAVGAAGAAALAAGAFLLLRRRGSVRR